MARDPATDTDALVAASATVFGRLGYRNATIDDIAAAAKISRPTVYKYTRSKRELLDLMVTHVSAYLGARVAEEIQKDAPATVRLHQLVCAHVMTANANSEFYRIILREQFELSEETAAVFRQWERSVTRDFRMVLEECSQEIHLVDGLDLNVVANLVLSMTISLPNWFDPAGAVSQTELVAHIWRFLSGVMPGLPTGQQ